MKKLLLLFAFLSFAYGIFAQVSKTVNLTIAGTLSTTLTSNELNTITNLTLTGNIDARDFKTMRDEMPLLTVLDLGGVMIAAYEGKGGASNTLNYLNYPSNGIPEFAFYITTTNQAKSLKSVVLPSSITSIGGSAFWKSNLLTSVTIPLSVTSIGNSAFSGCSGLTTFTIPSSITSIGYNVFSGCSKLTTITIPSSVTSIGNNAFQRCSGLTTVQIPLSVTSIGNRAFQGCSGLTSVQIPSTVNSIGQEAFQGCSGLTSVQIPSSVTAIGSGTFSNCSGLSTVSIPYSVTSIGMEAFQGCSGLTTIAIPSSITFIGYSAFSGCSGLTSVNIPALVTTIGDLAFENCTGLIDFTIPASVTSIGDYIFKNCSRLTSISTSRITPTNVSSYVFYQVNTTTCTLYVPVGSKSAYQAAYQWKDFTNIVEKDFTGMEPIISINLTSAGTLSTSFVSDDLYNITKLKITGTIDARDFKTMRDNMPLLAVLDLSEVTIAAYNGTAGTSYGIPDYPANVIPYYAFVNSDTRQGKTSLISVVLPSSVISIEYNAFSGCSGLTSVTIPSSVITIGNSAFSGCSRLTSVTIPSSVTTMGTYAFSSCIGLTSVTIPSSVTTIEHSAFSGCSGLTTVTIPSSVTTIGNYAFSGCSGLTTVTIPSSVTSIGNYSFAYCRGLMTVTIPSSVTSIGGEAFSGCSGLTSITTSSITPINLSLRFNVFQAVNKTTCTLYVPLGSKSAYQAAGQWKDFNNIVETIYTGIDPSIGDQQLTVYPNPTTGKVKLVFDQVPQKGTMLTVNDFTGKTILTRSIQNKEERIDLDGNSPGVYLISTNLKDFKCQKIILK